LFDGKQTVFSIRLNGEGVMTSTLFLLCPIIFGALCLLIGQTIHWFKKESQMDELAELVVVIETGRK